MVDGSVATQGTAAEIIAGRTVTEVRTEYWQRAFSLLEHDGFAAQLHGASLRVSATPRAVAAILSTEDIPADIAGTAANLEEAFVAIVTSGEASARDASADRGVR